MSNPLLNHMYTRFREVFGTPNTMLELDSQWTLRPASDPRAPALFLMVNGSYEKPAVWVFDPYDGSDNVWRTAVEAESDVNKIIEIVQDRVAAASRSWLNGRKVGHADGHLDGHADGHLDGRKDGHIDGHAAGGKDGHVDGHAAGGKDGHVDGHPKHRPGSKLQPDATS